MRVGRPADPGRVDQAPAVLGVLGERPVQPRLERPDVIHFGHRCSAAKASSRAGSHRPAPCMALRPRKAAYSTDLQHLRDARDYHAAAKGTAPAAAQLQRRIHRDDAFLARPREQPPEYGRPLVRYQRLVCGPGQPDGGEPRRLQPPRRRCLGPDMGQGSRPSARSCGTERRR